MVWPSRGSQASALAWVSRRDQEECHEMLSTVPLLGEQRSGRTEKARDPETLHSQQAKLRLSLSTESYLYFLQTSSVLHGSCLSTCICLSWHHSVNQPESLEAARNCSTPPEVFWCVSLCGVPTNAAQLPDVRWTNTFMPWAKTPSSRIVSRARRSRASFPCVCFREINVPSWALLNLNLWPRQENTVQHDWLSKVP